jgi:hypothetical protein
VPAANLDVVRRLLELAHHHISQKRIGATLLYALSETPEAPRRRDEGIAVAGLGLSALNESDEALLLHQARYRDGALLFGRDGHLLAVNVIMRPTRRHTSAARHTFDCPDVLAFVISTDGPVTVFSDGQRVADLKAQNVRKTEETIAALIAERRGDHKP